MALYDGHFMPILVETMSEREFVWLCVCEWVDFFSLFFLLKKNTVELGNLNSVRKQKTVQVRGKFWVLGVNFSVILIKGREILFELAGNSGLSEFKLSRFFCNKLV